MAGFLDAAGAADPEFAGAIDLGADTSVLTRVSTRSLHAELLRNDMSNDKTPMCLSFAGGHRSFGEVAAQLKTTNRDCSVESLLRYVDYAHRSPEDRSEMRFQPLVGKFETHDEVGHLFCTEVNGVERKMRGEQLLAMMLSNLESFTRVDGKQIPLSIVVPDSFSRAQRQAVRDAAHLAKLDLRELVLRSEAAAMYFGSKRTPEVLSNTATVIVDIGHVYTSVSVYEWDGKRGTRVAACSAEGLGGEAIDLALYDALCANCSKRFPGSKILPGSKASVRLMTQVRKLKEHLSGVGEAAVTVESLFEDQDVRFSFTREEMEEICSPIQARLTELIKGVLAECNEETKAKISFCELIGGGMRIPMIKAAIQDGIGEGVALAYTMDSMAAVAVGAALCCARLFQPKSGGVIRPAFDNLAQLDLSDDAGLAPIAEEERSEFPSLMDAEALGKAMALEEELRELDQRARDLHAARNAYESKIFETRGLVSGSKPHAELIEQDVVRKVVDDAEAWLYDYSEGGGSSESVTVERFKAKLEELNAALDAPLQAYNAKLQEEHQRVEAEMAAEAQRAAEELEASGGKDDHDSRKLKKPERMRKVLLNKEEGNSHFKDGNFEVATLRYVRALQHCDKFFDLGPEDVKEVDAIKLSLHLNSAQCYIKVKNFPEAAKSARAALELDGDSVKALYRLAFALSNQNENDEAKKLLAKAAKLAPEDAAVQKLAERVQALIKREDARRRAMAKRMFS